MRAKFRVSLLTVALLGPVLVAGPASAQQERVSVLAEGLNSPRGVATDADGNVYVAESGTGGTDCIGEGDEQMCFGTTSNITRVAADGTVDRGFVTGLPSISMHGDAVGASGVSIAPDGTVYISVGLGANASARDELVAGFPEGAMLGTLVRVSGDDELEIVADIAQYEDDNDVDDVTEDPEAGPDSNANAVLALDDVVYVADAGGNSVLAVDPETGDITVAAVLPPQMATVPPEMGGGEMPSQAVPTSLATTAEGDILVGQLTGFPFPVGGASVYALTDDAAAPAVVESGFTNIMGVAERGTDLFVLEFTRNGLLSGDMTGALVRVREDGSRIDLLADRLMAPGGLAAGSDGMLYVSNGAVLPGGGELLAFDASLAADAASAAACPPDLVMPGAGLEDASGTLHEEAIDCLAWHGLFTGLPDGTFGAQRDISRAQMASVVARLVTAAGGEVPADGPTFSDVPAGSTHEAAIRGLAEAGVISGFADGSFGPNQEISRAQTAALLVRAYAYVTGEPLAAGTDTFTDDDGSVHEPAIQAAAQAGWVRGITPTTFAPGADITRGQSATILARVASTLVAEGHLELPA